MHIFDYVPIGFLIVCMLSAAAMALGGFVYLRFGR